MASGYHTLQPYMFWDREPCQASSASQEYRVHRAFIWIDGDLAAPPQRRPFSNLLAFQQLWDEIDIQFFNTKLCGTSFFLLEKCMDLLSNEGFPGGSEGEESTGTEGDGVWPLGWEDAPEKGMATHCSILACCCC